MNLHQRLYSLSHNPAVGVTPFVNEVLSVVCQLESIKCKPQKDEITDKLLIGLHSSFAAVHTNLALCIPEPSIKEIAAALKEFEDNETLQPSISASIDSAIKEESLLYTNRVHCHGSGGGVPRTRYDDFDWGNTKNRDGVCFHCGHSSHVAQNCMADMPQERILNHHAHCAHIATEDTLSLALVQLPADDPLTLALSRDHHAHIAIDSSSWRIFGPDEDVPIEFRTADGYVN
jgi:hypothetical protein